MGILAWIIFGALAGWISSLIMKTDAEQGALMNVVVGIIGAFIGGLVMSLFGSEGVTGFNIRSFIVAIIGACVALAIYRTITRRTVS